MYEKRTRYRLGKHEWDIRTIKLSPQPTDVQKAHTS